MSKLRVLIADNTHATLETYAEALYLAGYHVIQATSPEETRAALEDQRIHLALLDLRLMNDSDEKDKSGLIVARKSARSVPKIVLTKFPVTEDVRTALKFDAQGRSIAVDFVDQRLGLDEVFETIVQVVDHHVRINWDLSIRWNPPSSFTSLMHVIDPDIESTLRQDRADELEDLFRKLFYDDDQITIGRLLDHGDGYVILEVFAYDAAGHDREVIVTCGLREAVIQEQERHSRFAPTAAGTGGTVQIASEETVRFAATSYTTVGAALTELTPFRQLYDANTTAMIA